MEEPFKIELTEPLRALGATRSREPSWLCELAGYVVFQGNCPIVRTRDTLAVYLLLHPCWKGGVDQPRRFKRDVIRRMMGRLKKRQNYQKALKSVR